MKIKDKAKVSFYGYIILGIFAVTWIMLLNYTAFLAPTYPDEAVGRIYTSNQHGKTVYLTLTEEILTYGSIIGFAITFIVLQIVTRDSDGKE
ncbi:MAG: hypothetical protein H0U87_06860 [Acidobacteria bacterium]|jgi:hypothetical protein|nr:hypothetical protein [Acidobacteriota bacterium]